MASKSSSKGPKDSDHGGAEQPEVIGKVDKTEKVLPADIEWPELSGTGDHGDPMKAVPQNLSEQQKNRLATMAADLPGILEYAHSVGGFAVIPTEEGVIKNQSMQAMAQQSQMQMDQIMEQMQLLAKQAQTIKERVHVSAEIYGAKMSFKPIVGEVYYLYEKTGEKNRGQKQLSIIAPEEWEGYQKTLRALAKVELLADHTWKILESYDA